MKIALVCSNGGHLVELQQLRKAYEKYDHFYITLEGKDTKNMKNTYLLKKDWGPMFFQQVYFAFESLKILMKERPDVIISTGGGMAAPFCYVGKMIGARVVFIESLARMSSRSKGGKAIYPVADIFLVQWEKIKDKFGKKAKFRGAVF